MALRQQQQQQQQQAGMGGTPSFLHWTMQSERPEPTQDFMEQQTNSSASLMPAPLSIREPGSNGEANPAAAAYFPAGPQPGALESLRQMGMAAASRGLTMHEMSLEQPNGQYIEDQQKKAKVEGSMGFATSSSAAEAVSENTVTRDHQQSEQTDVNGGAADWPPHPANHHPNAFTNGGLFSSFSQVHTIMNYGETISSVTCVVTLGLSASLPHNFCKSPVLVCIAEFASNVQNGHHPAWK